ncbi:MAG: alanine racemase [Planctomycetes bacterium]|nr:alanine racemase [Planctomycetota bacterium]
MGMKEAGHPSLRRIWAEVNLSAIADNVRYFRGIIGPDRLLMPAVKADAYGHGAEPVARAVLAGGADRLAVATCLEGQSLREAGIGISIQVLGALLPEEVRTAIKYDLTLSIHEPETAGFVSREAALAGKVVPVHVKIDTGMGRLGILPENAVKAAREASGLPGLRLEGVFMHFADAGDEAYSRFQLAGFNQACSAIEQAGISGFVRHAANSAASLLYPEARFDMIRPGAGIYGYHSPGRLRKDFTLRPALSLKSAVIQVKSYPAGSSLGYGRTFTTSRPTRIAILPLGYADGYRREFSNRAEVLIRGMRAPVVGMVSMDYAMADVTSIGDIPPGTEATMLGEDGGDRIWPEELAEWGETIPYCLTTGLGKRVDRRYVGDL